ncbi:hypothetical protein TSAR_004766 [Trichomalopsis sarcophagae]|uniref:Uncharacterized protein n=1 Tax=Trichomalopsis sarcophagae TaxID=543379 RepID=A0A232EK50_9HYME|nr:hypothetical protein TSAR_004766 [Trichomalopsis sarcophagae]
MQCAAKQNRQSRSPIDHTFDIRDIQLNYYLECSTGNMLDKRRKGCTRCR